MPDATFDLSGGFTPLTRVRAALGDVDMTRPKFSDALIGTFLTDNADDWQKAAVALLKMRIATLAHTPNFQADWLKVDVNTALKELRAQLAGLESDYGLGADSVETGSVFPARNDIAPIPTYPEGWPYA